MTVDLAASGKTAAWPRVMFALCLLNFPLIAHALLTSEGAQRLLGVGVFYTNLFLAWMSLLTLMTADLSANRAAAPSMLGSGLVPEPRVISSYQFDFTLSAPTPVGRPPRSP